LRERVSAQLGHPVSDEIWDQLHDLGFVQEAEEKGSPEQVPYLVDRIHQRTSTARSMTGAPRPAAPDRPDGAAASARIDALSAIYAAWADTDTDVRLFRMSTLVCRDTPEFLAYLQRRGPHPGYELLQPDQVAAWIKDQHDRIANHGDGDEHVRQLIMDRRAHEPSLTTSLRYMRGNHEQTLTVDAKSPLGELAKVTEKLVRRYRWAPSQATACVLTGRMPEVLVYTGSAQIRYGIDSSATTRVTMTLDPSLTPEQVARIYARLRANLRDDPPRSLSVKHCRLAEHVGPHVQFYVQEPGKVRRPGRRPAPGPTGLAQFIDPVHGYSWQTLHRDWNARYADPAEDGRPWRYEHLSNFTRDAQSALTRLLNPGWRMRDQ
jgi:hypothetical protein